jgi:hypothetical protein
MDRPTFVWRFTLATLLPDFNLVAVERGSLPNGARPASCG